jgi:hypothetical protein
MTLPNPASHAPLQPLDSERQTCGCRHSNPNNCDSTFRKLDLSNVKIIDCDVQGMTIDGILVTDLTAAYKAQKK